MSQGLKPAFLRQDGPNLFNTLPKANGDAVLVIQKFLEEGGKFNTPVHNGTGQTHLMLISKTAGLEGIKLFFEQDGRVTPGAVNTQNGKNELMYIVEYAGEAGLLLAMQHGLRFSMEKFRPQYGNTDSESVFYARFCPDLVLKRSPCDLNQDTDRGFPKNKITENFVIST